MFFPNQYGRTLQIISALGLTEESNRKLFYRVLKAGKGFNVLFFFFFFFAFITNNRSVARKFFKNEQNILRIFEDIVNYILILAFENEFGSHIRSHDLEVGQRSIILPA